MLLANTLESAERSAKGSPDDHCHVGIVMGSDSDWPVMQAAATMLKEFGVAFEARVVSAHRTPDLLFDYAGMAQERGLRAIIAGAGGAAHLPGMLASKTIVPVLGVPVPQTSQGLDSLLSIVQMPKGVRSPPCHRRGRRGECGADAIAIIATANDDYGRALAKIEDFRSRQSEKVWR